MVMKKTLFFIFITICAPAIAQNQINGFDFISNIKNDINIGQIDFYVKKEDPCSLKNEKNLFGINSTVANTNAVGYLNFKVQVTDCGGKIFEQSISIQLSNLQEGFTENIMSWELAGKLTTPPYQIVLSNFLDKTKIVQKGQVKPTDPDSLIIKNVNNNTVAYGDPVLLEIVGGDDLNNSTNTHWSWHIGSMFSKEIITQDKNYSFIPQTNTTVYVAAVTKTSFGTINSKTVSKVIYVDTKSEEPISIIAENSTICSNGNGTNISINGGKLGKMAQWVWYKNGCGDDGAEILAKGVDNLKVIPRITSTYYVRAEGSENFTKCKETTIEVVEPPQKPAIQLVGNKEICQGEVVTFVLPGQITRNSDKSQWEWYKRDFNGALNNPGSTDKLNLIGNLVKITPSTSSYYFVISKGGVCNSITSDLIGITLNNKSSNITIENEQIQNSRKYRLSADANNLGKNAKWIWYESKYRTEKDLSSSSLKILKRGVNDIEIKSKKKEDKFIYISGQGDCDVPPIINGSITIPKFQQSIVNKSKTRSKNNFNNIISSDIFRASPVEAQFILNVGKSITDDQNLNTEIYTLGYTTTNGPSEGFYLKYMKTNSSMYPTDNLTADNKTQTILDYPNDGTYYKFNNKVKSFNVHSYMIGKMYSDFNQSVTLYGGYGYGEIKTIWGYDKYNSVTNKYLSSGYAKNNSKSYGGLALELGLMFRVWYFNINGGVSGVFGISEVKDPTKEPTTSDPYADKILSFEKFIKGHFGIGISILSRK